jgi:FMN phosphatase YigB (HAD superfamily)
MTNAPPKPPSAKPAPGARSNAFKGLYDPSGYSAGAKTGDNQILVKILDEARDFIAKDRLFLAVFDLDSTLFDLSFRIATIVDGFTKDSEMRTRFPKECAALENVEIRSEDWGLVEALKRLNIFENTHPEFWRDLHEYWAMHFFTGDYFQHDEPIPGAVEFVNEMRAIGAEIMYLTGRDVPRMLDGSHKALIARGFPVNETDAQLVLKPHAEMDDAYFKLAVLQEAEEYYDRIWLFENEPVNTNLIAKECPEIGIVFIESTHSGREQPAHDVARIQHWKLARK